MSPKCHKTGKRKFETLHEANVFLKDIKKTSTRERIPLRSYFCGACEHYHLTNRKKPIQKISLKHLSGGDLKQYEDF